MRERHRRELRGRFAGRLALVRSIGPLLRGGESDQILDDLIAHDVVVLLRDGQPHHGLCLNVTAEALVIRLPPERGRLQPVDAALRGVAGAAFPVGEVRMPRGDRRVTVATSLEYLD